MQVLKIVLYNAKESQEKIINFVTIQFYTLTLSRWNHINSYSFNLFLISFLFNKTHFKVGIFNYILFHRIEKKIVKVQWRFDHRSWEIVDSISSEDDG